MKYLLLALFGFISIQGVQAQLNPVFTQDLPIYNRKMLVHHLPDSIYDQVKAYQLIRPSAMQTTVNDQLVYIVTGKKESMTYQLTFNESGKLLKTETY